MSNSVIVQTKMPDGLCKEGFTGANMMITIRSSPISQIRKSFTMQEKEQEMIKKNDIDKRKRNVLSKKLATDTKKQIPQTRMLFFELFK